MFNKGWLLFCWIYVLWNVVVLRVYIFWFNLVNCFICNILVFEGDINFYFDFKCKGVFLVELFIL